MMLFRVLVLVSCIALCSAATINVYVSSTGNDAGNGTSAAPYQTLNKMLSALLALSPIKDSVNVYLDGTFYITNTIDFGNLVILPSGSLNIMSTTRVVVSGGYKVTTSWSISPSNNHVYVTSLPVSLTTHQMFVNNYRRVRARSPNIDVYTDNIHSANSPFYKYNVANNNNHAVLTYQSGLGRNGFVFRNGDVLPSYQNQQDVQLVIYEAWNAGRVKIQQIIPGNNTILFTENVIGYPIGTIGGAKGYYIENAIEYLDYPGEWYLDSGSNKLYYYPLAGEDPNKLDIFLSNLTVLFSVHGSSSQKTHNITIQGITFMHTDWVCSVCNGQSNEFLRDAGVVIKDAENITIFDCEFSHMGEQAIAVLDNSAFITINKNHIWDSAGGGIQAGTSSPTASNQVSYVEITNNYIHGCGRVFQAGTGVFVKQANHVHISHNEIADLYYSGVCVGWSWGYSTTLTHDNIVEYNHIHHIGQGELSDMAGVYTLGLQNGTKIRYNIIHDVLTFEYGAWGLYMDEGTSYTEWMGNLVYGTKDENFHMHYGSYNTFSNNLLFSHTVGNLRYTSPDGHFSVTYSSNMIVSNGYYTPHTSNFETDSQQFQFNSNIYVNMTCGPITFPFGSWSAWQSHGQDTNSIIVSVQPLSTVQEQANYLNTLAQATSKGWVTIDLTKPGLLSVDSPVNRGSDWVSLPNQFPFPQQNPSSFIPPFLEGVGGGAKDSFESEQVNSQPSLGSSFVGSGDPAAMIAISADQSTTPTPFNGVNVAQWSASELMNSKQSLKIVDSSIINPDWSPVYNVDLPKTESPSINFYFGCDLYVGLTGFIRLEFRNWLQSSYFSGPQIDFSALPDKTVAVSQTGYPFQLNSTLSANKWLHVEVTFGLGSLSNNKYILKIWSDKTAMPQVVEYNFQSTVFSQAVTWIGLESVGSVNATYYVDNLVYGPQTPGFDASMAGNSINVQFPATTLQICYFLITVQDRQGWLSPYYFKVAAQTTSSGKYTLQIPTSNLLSGIYNVSVAAITQPHMSFANYSPMQLTVTSSLPTTGQSTSSQSTNGQTTTSSPAATGQSTSSKSTSGQSTSPITTGENSSSFTKASLISILIGLVLVVF